MSLKKYDIALSFAGEQRDSVEQIYRYLDEKGLDVFYDESEDSQVRYLGKCFVEVASEVYTHARLVVVFISDEYLNKMWPSLEYKILNNRLLRAAFSDERVVFFKFGKPKLPEVIGTNWIKEIEGKDNNELHDYANLVYKRFRLINTIDKDTYFSLSGFGKYEDAIEYLESFLKKDRLSPDDKLFLHYNLACCNSRISSIKAMTGKDSYLDKSLENLTRVWTLLCNYETDDSRRNEVLELFNSDDDLLSIRRNRKDQLENIYPVKKINTEPTGYGGCVGLDTPIATPNGAVNIEDLNIGDVVYSCRPNIINEQFETKIVKILYSRQQAYLLNEEIVVSESQRLWCVDKGWIAVSQLNDGDNLMKLDGPRSVKKLEAIGEENVAIIEVEHPEHTFIGNEYICHNMKV